MSRFINKPARVVVLCNNRMAIPALQALSAQQMLCGIAVPESNADVIDMCRLLAQQTSVPLLLLQKEQVGEVLAAWLNKCAPDFVFTMTFPWKLPSEVWRHQYWQCCNFHYGLLPEMRGADPVFEAIRKQAHATGVTVHAIDDHLDKGGIIFRQEMPLEDRRITHGMLCTQLAYLAARMIPNVIDRLTRQIPPEPQDEGQAHYYKRAEGADVSIRWDQQNARAISALVRACNPWNKGAYTQWQGWPIRIVECIAADSDDRFITARQPGTVVAVSDAAGLVVQCNDNELLKINIIYTDEGFMSGCNLAFWGVKQGDLFVNL